MSFHPLALYQRDSDDSSSEGGFSDHHVAMGIANDRCDDDSAYSLDSDLFTDAGNDEMDGTGLEGNFNPQNLRIEAGKRVGIDTDDESDGDGEHGLYHRDRDVGIRGMDSRGMRGAVGSVSSGSFSAGNSSDDDIDWNMRGNGKNQTWLKDDKDLDDEMPVGSARAGQVVDAGQPSTIIANAEPRASKQTKEDKEAETSAKNKSRALVQEALAKARATKNPTAKAFLERRAEVIAGSGQVLAPSVREKGKSALQVLAKPSLAKGKLVGKQLEATAEAKAREEETSRRLYSGIEQRKIAKAEAEAERKKSLTDSKAERETKINKFLASKGLARLREATRESKLKKMLIGAKKEQVNRFLRMAIAKQVVSKMRATNIYKELEELAKGLTLDDDDEVKEGRSVAGKSVAKDPSTITRAGSLSAKGVDIVTKGGGFVDGGGNVVIMEGNKVMVNGQKLTGNRVNLDVIMELRASLEPSKAKYKGLVTALNKMKSMIDAGRGNGKPQSVVVLKKGGGGGGGGV